MKYFKLKFLLIFAALAMAIPPAWAGTETVVFSQQGYDNGEEVTSYVGTTFSLSFDKGDNTATPKYYDTGTGVRLYRSNNMTVSSSKTITKIELSFGSGDGTNAITTDVGTYSNGTWNGSATTVLFTVGGTSGHRRLSAVTVTTKDSGDPFISFEPNPLPINDNGGTFTVSGSNLPTDGLGVKYENSQLTDFSFNLDNGDNTHHYFPVTGGSLESGIVSINYTGRALSATALMNFESGSANETETINYRSDVYIVTDNGVTDDWHFERGVKMDYANNTYTGEFTSTNPNTYIVFARKLTESSDIKLWNNRLAFGPSSGGDWVYGTYTSGDLDLYNTNVIKFPEAGTYTITITAQDNKFSISKASEPTTYVKVTSADQFVVGKKYIFVHEGAKKAMGDITSGKGNPVDIVIKTDGKIDVADNSGVIEFTLGGTAYNYTFAIPGGGYLRYGSSTNIYGDGNPDNDANSYTKWKPRPIGSTSYSVTNVGNTDRSIKANSTSIKFGCYTHNDSNSDNIAIYVEDDGETPTQTVAIPTFDPVGGSYKTPQSVTINCATESAEIHYTTDGSDPDVNSALYTGPITVNTPNATTTIKAIGVKTDMNNSGIATAEYTLPQSVSSLAAANALAPETGSNGVDFFFTGDVVVTYAAGDYIWLRDVGANTGGGLFYRTGTEVTTPGAVLSQNWGASAKQYKGLIEFTNAEGVANSGNTAPYAPFDRTGVALTDAHMNEYIVFNNVRIDSKDDDNKTYTATYVGENREAITYQLYDQFGKSPEVGKTYNITGLVTKFNDIQVYPTNLELVKQDLTLGFDPASVEIYVGETFTAPTLNGLPEGATVTYSSDNTALATVTDNVVSLVKGATGTATITANFAGNDLYNSATASYTITVNEKLAHGMSFSSETLNVTYGDEDYEAPTLNNPNSLTVTYESDNEDVAVVDENTGELLLGDAGTAVITAKTKGDASHNGGSVSYTVNIAKAAAGLAYETAQYTVYAGQDFEAPTLTNPNKLTVTYESSNEDVALVDETGDVLIGEMVGDAKITAKFEGNKNYEAGSASYTIHVIAKDNVTMSFDPTSVTLYVDEEFAQPTLTTNPANLPVKYSSDNEEVAMVDETSGEVLLMEKAGTATITAKYAGNDQYNEASATYTITVENRPEILIDDESLDLGTTGEGEIFVMASDLKENVTVTSSNENFKVDPPTITPEQAANGVNVTVTYTGNNPEGESTTITFSTKDGEDVKVTVTAKAETYVALAAPTFAPAAGTYTEPKEVAIACATPGVTITYAIDGVDKGEYNGPFTISDGEHTVTATAKMGTRTVYTPATSSATYTINAASAATIADNYYFLQSNAAEVSGKYANVAGRRTLNFVADADKQAGTVFRIETGEGGAVKTLRSQAVDLQGYANRAMAYVPKAIELVLSTLNNASGVDDATGAGNILGENGVQLILKKFYENFDYNLYVEEGTEGTYRIYGRTPSMQHVVDFYHENTAQVEEKLPMLEDYINQVLDKIRSKIPAPYDANVVVPFSLKTVRDRIADKYGITLIDPTQDLMGFYRQVLNNKEYVWDFAYQTAMMYVDVIKETQTYKNLPDEYKLYVTKMEKVRPDTKYYIIERGNELDYISENNGEIISNDPRTLWTLTPRENFTVNVPEANKLNDSYYTTLYTDFAYTLPEGVTAYAVTGIDENDVAQLTEITGVIPAQTPVLLKADAAGNKVLTLKTDSRGGAIEGNLLEGPDYLINKYQFEAPTVVNLFSMAEGFVPADVLDEYSYLKLRNSGTVNNKYFWNVNSDLENITGINVLRSLSTNTGKLAFSDDSMTETNKAFMVSETEPVIYLSIDTVATPTLSLVAGSYTGEQTLTISCATDDVTISYSTDGGKNWTEGTSVTLTDDCTVMVKAEKEGMIPSEVVTAEYIIDEATVLPDVPAMKGYYQIKNNENEMYANVAGRRTLNFKSETEAESNAGTIFYLETNGKGQVQSLRSQGVDLQGYVNRAMHYVPDMVKMVVNTLQAEGSGEILGENGLNEIMEKFNECFDYHLYVEPVGQSWRIYGKTPSMQHVVDFYREHTAQVEAKLPMLEDFINDALTKLRNKIGGSTVFTDFSLHQIWENMGGNLPEPVVGDDAAIMDFYRAVLNNKNFVWDFAYQTAQIYWNNVKDHPRYNELKAQLGEYADYIDEFVNQVRPDFKYYIIQRGNEPDYISQGNAEINEPRSLWTLEPRETFKLNSAGELFGCPLAPQGVGGYFTTNYTDFAYTLHEGVTAYKVTDVDNDGEATLEALEGIIPAQTPVLLIAEEDGAYQVTLTTEPATADTTGNMLVGPDYLIKLYQFKTPMVVDLFTFAQGILGEDLYNTYVAPYEYLQLRYSGTVNNKYFWNVNSDLGDITGVSVVRSLSTETGNLAFSDNAKTETNKAFLVSDTFDVITLPSLERGDVNHDGYVNLLDVTDLIDRLLVNPDAEHLKACPYCSDVDGNGSVNIKDVTVLIDILLGNISPDPEEGDGN